MSNLCSLPAFEQDPGLGPTADHFITNKRLAGRSEFTLRLYRRVIDYLDDWLAENGHSRQVEDITGAQVNEFLREYRATHAPSSTETSRGYLSSFFKWAMREGLVDTDPMVRVPTITIPQTVPHVVSDEEFAAMLRVSAGPNFSERRDTAMLRLLESTGCRRGEIATALLANLNMPMQTLGVMGKGNKPRTVPFDDETANALHHYIRLRGRHRHNRRPELFPRAIRSHATDRCLRDGQAPRQPGRLSRGLDPRLSAPVRSRGQSFGCHVGRRHQGDRRLVLIRLLGKVRTGQPNDPRDHRVSPVETRPRRGPVTPPSPSGDTASDRRPPGRA